MTKFPITPAVLMPITIEQARRAVRADGTELDDELTDAIVGMTSTLENDIEQCVMPQTWRVLAESFPAAGLPLPHPARSIGAVTYLDSAGAEQTLDAASYRTVVTRYESLLVAKTGYSFPATDGSVDAVKADVVAWMAETQAATPTAIALYIELKLKQQFDPAARLERDTIQSNYIDDLLGQFKVQP